MLRRRLCLCRRPRSSRWHGCAPPGRPFSASPFCPPAPPAEARPPPTSCGPRTPSGSARGASLSIPPICTAAGSGRPPDQSGMRSRGLTRSVAAAIQQGLGQDNGLSMPSWLCRGGLSEYSNQVLLQLCKLQGASILIKDRPNLSLLQSQQHLTTNSAIEPVFKAQER